MKVILMENIKGVGRIGEVKNVADGYGRNFLLARRLAKLATDSAMRDAEVMRRRAETSERIEQNKAKELLENMKDIVVEIKRKANEKGTLFDGLEAMDISAAIKNKVSFNLKADMVHLKEPIKHTGKHIVEIELTPETKTQITIEVKSE